MGGYETLQEQSVARDSTIPFICFTDDPNLVSETWDVRVVAPQFPADSVRSARTLKIIGHSDLEDFDQTLWIDNRVRLTVDPVEILDSWLISADIAVHEHSFRDKLIDEFSAVADGGYDDADRVYEQLIHYAEAFPEELEKRPLWTGLIARRHTAEVSVAMRDWWAHVLRYSRRDQLSASVVLNRSGCAVTVLPSPSNEESSVHEWPPIGPKLGRRTETRTTSFRNSIQAPLARLREAELAVAAFEERKRDLESEATEWEEKVRYRDEAIRQLQADARHSKLMHRDYVIGVEAQLATVRAEFADANARFTEISDGFANALAILDERRDRIERLQGELKRSRSAFERQRDIAVDRARELKKVRASATWRIGRVFVKPFSIFKR